MTRRLLARFADWCSEPDLEPDAEPVTHALQCAVCGRESAAFEDFEAARRWMYEHVSRSPTHLTYREIIRRPWRVWMKPEVPR